MIQVARERDLLMGKVDFGGVSRDVCLEYVPEAVAGDYVLIHVGFALSKISKEEAHRIFEILEELDQIQEAGG